MKTRIAIVGGGLAGLTLGYLLKNSELLKSTQVEFTIFEATNRVGGRVFTLHDFDNGLFAEAGALSISSNEEYVLNIIKELGLETVKRTDRSKARFYKDGKWLEQDNNDIKKIIQFLFKEAKRLKDEKIIVEDKDWIATDEFHQELKRLDNISLIPFLKENISSGKLKLDSDNDLKANTESGLLGLYSDNIEDLSVWDALRYLSQYLTSQCSHSIQNGNDQLPIALEKILYEHIRLNMPVSKVTVNEKDTILITFNSGMTEEFDYAVIATPLTSLQKNNPNHIQFDPVLPKKKEKAINQIAYNGNVARTYFFVKKRFWKNENPETGMVITKDLWIEDHSASLDKKEAILEAHTRGKLAADIIHSENSEQKSADAIKNIYGEKFEKHCDISKTMSIFWLNNSYQRGAYPFFKPGQKKYLQKLRENVGKIFFAGGDISLDCSATINGAVKSGEEIYKKLQSKIIEDTLYQIAQKI